VGCGFGDILEYIHEKRPGCKLYGIDTSRAMIAETRGIKAIFKVADAQKLPFKQSTFDIVIAKHMLYHVANIKVALNEMHKVLKPKGRLVITLNGVPDKTQSQIEYYRKMIGKIIGSRLIPTSARINTENYDTFIDNAKFRKIKEIKFYTYGNIKNSGLLLDYLSSFKEFFMPIPKDEDWRKALNEIKNNIDKQIQTKGSVRITRKSGLFILEKIGG
jgi:ubiquinone/menaquinone biosynthesis C-methylase UbiE